MRVWAAISQCVMSEHMNWVYVPFTRHEELYDIFCASRGSFPKSEK